MAARIEVTADLELNEAYLPYIEWRGLYALLYGGAGSGKSHAVAQKVVLRCFTEARHRFLAVRKVKDTQKESQFELLLEAADALNIPVNKRVSPLLIEFPTSGSKILFRGMDDPEKIKSIHGVTSVWIEEATELTADDFDQLVKRVRSLSGPYPQFTLSFNPVSVFNWVHQRWFEKADAALREQTLYLKTTWLDNAKLPEGYGATLAADKDRNPLHYQVYALGEWGQPQGAVYQPFTTCTAGQWPKGQGEVWYGLDFGFEAPTALFEWRLVSGWLFGRELFYERGLTTDQIGEKLKAKTQPGALIYADSAEPDRIATLQMMGLVVVKCKKGPILAGVNHVRACHHRIRIYDGSVNFLKEAATYVLKPYPGSTHLTDEPQKGNDHLLDAMRYGLYSHTYHRTDLMSHPIKA